jgi:hypothetical protein
MIRSPRFLSIALLLLVALPSLGATAANNDSCEIGVTPAATLLLPYFEVANNRVGELTLFTVTNVTPIFQVARVTLWTDFAYPVISFDLFFEPYEVRRIDLYDVIWRGVLDPSDEDSICGANTIGEAEMKRAQRAFTVGAVTPLDDRPGCNNVGNLHANAVGYATVDVIGGCASGTTPLDARHFNEDLRFDNVFIGDYQQVNSTENFAQGNPMVHIRAIPEGGTPQSRRNNPNLYANQFPRTFYGRLQDPAHPTADGRQPLPTTFAARYIQGGTGSFQTHFKIWREAVTDASARCSSYLENREIMIRETVVFDEDDNAEGTFSFFDCPICVVIGIEPISLPTTSLTSISDDEVFPQQILDSEVAGWIYFNLDAGGAREEPLQAWVVASMRAEGRYSVDLDAAVLGNGCTPLIPTTAFSEGGETDRFIGPAADFIP